jgi:hypothetical protein
VGLDQGRYGGLVAAQRDDFTPAWPDSSRRDDRVLAGRGRYLASEPE